MRRFSTKIYNADLVPMSAEILTASSMGIMNLISREYRMINMEVAPHLIRRAKARIKTLRAIRKDLKLCLKKCYKTECNYADIQ